MIHQVLELHHWSPPRLRSRGPQGQFVGLLIYSFVCVCQKLGPFENGDTGWEKNTMTRTRILSKHLPPGASRSRLGSGLGAGLGAASGAGEASGPGAASGRESTAPASNSKGSRRCSWREILKCNKITEPMCRGLGNLKSSLMVLVRLPLPLRLFVNL